ncbi:DUF4838 domain-containing protein [Horticoccus luteus]|uniref:DUF4838 domain-containing protein n=1 Tax=Horticoccus luteus TaxID=2862869 RepID=A0A8F9TRA9_9BACT|nr:DUF4838 domain-containing protein [Horticoccus luteus]QYM77565.1 DUF4838 domain-containing protein [Horticoccus luteus]
MTAARRASAAWLLLLAGALLAVVAIWTHRERVVRLAHAAVVFSPEWPGCELVVPADARDEEWEAARMLADGLAKAAGTVPAAFPIVLEDAAENGARAIFVGATRRGAKEWLVPNAAPFDTGVAYRVEPGAVIITSEARASIMVAAAWFLEQTLNAEWFVPGARGEVIPRRDSLVLRAGRVSARPAFLSRSLSGIRTPEERAWYRANAFEQRIGHGHSFDRVFSPDVVQANPELAPVLRGQRYFPNGESYEWQPNIANPHAADIAARVIGDAFAADPARRWYSLCENDSIYFDQSAETQALVLPLKYFRRRPDFSDMVFGFTNAVAKKVAQDFPDRFIPAYAYFWTENTPTFAVEPNLVPILTADRSQWFDPAFAREDQALIQRWCASGAKLVGVYDYFYGAPFLVPRPTLYAVRASIPFEHRAGVRVFFAEANPNWALDGPKMWLTAKLLWDPERNADQLLATYYREFWGRAAAPMRRFYGLAEEAWQTQPRPGYWIKFYADEQQALLFGRERRAQMRACLEEARRATAKDAMLRDRLDFVDAGFRLTEAFADFCEARDALSLQLEDPTMTPAVLMEAWRTFHTGRAAFLAEHVRVRTDTPLAVRLEKISKLMRYDPTARLAARWAELAKADASVARFEREVSETLGLHGAEELSAGAERLRDPQWKDLIVQESSPLYACRWTPPGAAWFADKEAVLGRRVKGIRTVEGGKTLRFSGCAQDYVGQTVMVKAGELCDASVSVRAKVSAGNETSVGVVFLDADGNVLPKTTTDRLPVGETRDSVRLRAIARAPEEAAYVRIVITMLRQVNDDYAEWSRPSLRVGP